MPDTINAHKKMIQQSDYDEFEICFNPAKPDGTPDDSVIIKTGPDLTRIILNQSTNVEKVTLFMIQMNLDALSSNPPP